MQPQRAALSEDPHSGENHGYGDAARESRSKLVHDAGPSPRAALSTADGRAGGVSATVPEAQAQASGELDGSRRVVQVVDAPMSVLSGDMGAASFACPGDLSVCRAPAAYVPFSFSDSDMDLGTDGDSCSGV